VVLGQVTLSTEGFRDSTEAFLQPFQHKGGSLRDSSNQVKHPTLKTLKLRKIRVQC
jgi:hypothetical protein